jgi:outer membrane protein assembly factor BamA
MAKLKLLAFGLLLICDWAAAQTVYPVHYTLADSARADTALLKVTFPDRLAAMQYVAGLPTLLQGKGYVSASVDSARFDSLAAHVTLFLGKAYQWAAITTAPEDEDVLQAVRWNAQALSGSLMNFSVLEGWKVKLLDHLEERGHPFARIYLDSFGLEEDKLSARLNIYRGPLYHIDSIRVYGDVKIDNRFLQRYLDITNGSVYNKKKLHAISSRLATLTYVQEVQPSNLTLLGTGSVLNLYLKQRRSSQVAVLVGLLPNSDATASKKFLVTGEANILLRNALGAAETIGLNWQQLQVQSPRLNLLYDHPYIFQSSFGLSFQFDMLRKDTAFLNVAMRLGAVYQLSATQSATFFVQRRSTIVNGINVAAVQRSKRLPQDGDVSSVNLGITYEVNTTNYRFNPRQGWEWTVTASAGTKKLKENNTILELKDPFDPQFDYARLYDTVKLKTYQFRVQGSVAKYFPLGRQSAFKTAIQAGVFQSETIFRNETFQIGGYKLLRGFDEESQFVSQYAIATGEYRYLVGPNSAFFAFVDGGWAKHPLANNSSYGYISSGLGLSFETGAGIFNLAWAVGKRSDAELNLRQSKIHLGFVNYF